MGLVMFSEQGALRRGKERFEAVSNYLKEEFS